MDEEDQVNPEVRGPLRVTGLLNVAGVSSNPVNRVLLR